MKKHVLSFVVLISFISVLFAATAYQNGPAIPQNKDGIITIKNDNNTPKLERDTNNNLNIEFEGEFNYETTWTYNYTQLGGYYKVGDDEIVPLPEILTRNEAGHGQAPAYNKYIQEAVGGIAAGKKIYLTADLSLKQVTDMGGGLEVTIYSMNVQKATVEKTAP